MMRFQKFKKNMMMNNYNHNINNSNSKILMFGNQCDNKFHNKNGRKKIFFNFYKNINIWNRLK